MLSNLHKKTGGICCVDSAFLASDAPHLVKSAQDTTKAQNTNELPLMSQATSLRQPAEWGMHAIQSSMPGLKDGFSCELEDKAERERNLVLRIVPHLCNFRLEFVGLNQIQSAHIPSWSRDADFCTSTSD